MPPLPVLWSFRRCPYAMRARLAILASGLTVELREILLRDKPAAFLDTSPSGTVPCLDTGSQVIDESRDIMIWALRQSDPQGLLTETPEALALIATNDGPFKQALDRTKYDTRYPDSDASAQRTLASGHLMALNARLAAHLHLMGDTPTLPDLAIFPFVRQFAHIDRAWFDAQDWPHLIRWLDHHLAAPAFAAVMTKYPPWHSGQDTVVFPEPQGQTDAPQPRLSPR